MASENRPFTYGKLGLSERELFELRTEQIRKRDTEISLFLGSRGLQMVQEQEYRKFILGQAKVNVAPQVSDVALAEKLDFADRYEAGLVGHMLAAMYRPSTEMLGYSGFIEPIPAMARSALFAATLAYGDSALYEIREEKGEGLYQDDIVDTISGPVRAYFEQTAA